MARFAYDAVGRPVRADVGGRTTTYDYDDAGRLVDVVAYYGAHRGYDPFVRALSRANLNHARPLGNPFLAPG